MVVLGGQGDPCSCPVCRERGDGVLPRGCVALLSMDMSLGRSNCSAIHFRVWSHFWLWTWGSTPVDVTAGNLIFVPVAQFCF